MYTSTINNVINNNTNTEECMMTKEEIREHLSNRLNVKTAIENSGVREWTWYDNWVPTGIISYSYHENKHMHKVTKEDNSIVDSIFNLVCGCVLIAAFCIISVM